MIKDLKNIIELLQDLLKNVQHVEYVDQDGMDLWLTINNIIEIIEGEGY